MDYRVVLSPSARRDLKDIVRYISVDNRERAQRFGLMLLSSTKRLAQFLVIGRVVPELQDASIREIIVRSYRVVYRLREPEQRVEVIRFWHAARERPIL